MLNKIVKFFLIYFLIFMISGIVAYVYISRVDETLTDDMVIKVDPATGVKIDIPQGATTDEIAKILKTEELIGNETWFKLLSKFNGYDGGYKFGQHILKKELTDEEIMKILCSSPVSVTVTIPEGKNFNEIVGTLSASNLINKDKFIAAANNEEFKYKFLEKVPKRKNRLDGYLFPDTYFVQPNTPEKDIIKMFLNNFDSKFKPEYYKRAQELKMSVDQVIILASIIERETKNADERASVSNVFHKRLKSKDPNLKKLQSCATIQYILLQRDGKVKEKLSNADTRIQDDYNTYLKEGLPPGPICCPGIASIEAALYPNEEADYLFFVAKGDGSHEFSKTLQEHEAAKKKYGVNY